MHFHFQILPQQKHSKITKQNHCSGLTNSSFPGLILQDCVVTAGDALS